MRIRTIKPEFWSHPIMAKQTDATKLLAIGLLNVADDEGYFFAEPKLIRNAIRPLDDDSGITTVALRELSEIGYILIRKHLTHGDIGKVESFLDHQVINKPKPSIIKALHDSGINTVAIPDSYGLEGKGREQGKEGKGADSAGAESVIEPSQKPRAKNQDHPYFDEFWENYPKKEGKHKAIQSWNKEKPDIDDVINALKWQKKNWTDPKYIPLPATYLNQRRFEDEPTRLKPQVAASPFSSNNGLYSSI